MPDVPMSLVETGNGGSFFDECGYGWVSGG